MHLLSTDVYQLVNGYTYMGIAFYYIIFDFISPVSDEMSLITIAYLAKNNIVNVPGAAVMSFLAIYARNLVLFYLARNRVGLIRKLSDRFPEFMENYKQRMSKHLFSSVLILSFIPKLRILIPLAAGVGRASVSKFFFAQGVGLALFIAVFYPLGIFFYAAFKSVADKLNSVNHYYIAGGFLIITVLISFFAGKQILKKMKNF